VKNKKPERRIDVLSGSGLKTSGLRNDFRIVEDYLFVNPNGDRLFAAPVSCLWDKKRNDWNPGHNLDLVRDNRMPGRGRSA
jgi:hypothetical protein